MQDRKQKIEIFSCRYAQKKSTGETILSHVSPVLQEIRFVPTNYLK